MRRSSARRPGRPCGRPRAEPAPSAPARRTPLPSRDGPRAPADRDRPRSPPLERTLAGALPELVVPAQGQQFPAPRLVALNEPLATELGLDPDLLRSPEGLRLLTGRAGGTLALRYAGHQFGTPNPHMGDGRALLLGELRTPDGRLVDLQTKGTGLTPLSRPGSDGRAPLTAMLRELVIGETLQALGVPATRTLAVLATGEGIRRRGPVPEPGGIQVRVAASHLRFGTVQYAAWHHGPDLTARLAAYAVQRHGLGEVAAGGPSGDLGGTANADGGDSASDALLLLRHASRAHAHLVAQWMLLGFVHGVMNTDNMTLSGEAIDFGPCAFLDRHDPLAVFSSIDTGGRYAYGRQPGVAQWNLARLAEALLPVLHPSADRALELARAELDAFPDHYRDAWTSTAARHLGLPLGPGGVPEEQARDLAADALDLMAAQRLDHTATLRALAEGRMPGAAGAADSEAPDVLGVPAAAAAADATAWAAWQQRRSALESAADPQRVQEAHETARRTAPVVIPRNLVLESALRAAQLGDLGPVEEIVQAVREPTTPVTRSGPDREGSADPAAGGAPAEEQGPGLRAQLAAPGPDDAGFMTFCGT
ncbi:YdiU family protein [Brachybacterium sp. EF45031]|nr:YdiU family protein [Brachybacterium sillae]